MQRRHFLTGIGALASPAALYPSFLSAMQSGMDMKGGMPISSSPAGKADFTLRIEPCSLEIAPGVIIKTTSYNGQVPGPMLRFKEARSHHYRREQCHGCRRPRALARPENGCA
jgi:hypothetical protein